MDGICSYLGNKNLIDLCQQTNPYYVIGGSLLTAYVIAKICQCATPPNRLRSLQQRVANAQVASVAHPIAPNDLVNIKLFFEEIYRDFISERGKSSFEIEWKTKFEQFENHIRNRIVHEDMRDWGLAKGLKGDDLNAFVEGSYSLERERNKSLEFVRDLSIITDRHGNTFYPKDDRQVPRLLLQIIDHLETAISYKR